MYMILVLVSGVSHNTILLNQTVSLEEIKNPLYELLWSSIFVTLVAKKYHESVTLPSGLRMVYDNH